MTRYSRVLLLLFLGCISTFAFGCGENGYHILAVTPTETPSAMTVNSESTPSVPNIERSSAMAATSSPTSATPTLRVRVSTTPIDVAWQTKDIIWGSKVDGSGREEIVLGVDPFGQNAFSLSPDGRRIAFLGSRSCPSGGNGLFVADRYAGQLNHIAEGSTGVIVWSPDGKILAYEVLRDLGPAAISAVEVRVLNIESGHDIEIVSARSFVDSLVWTPDSSAIVFTHGSWQKYKYTGSVDSYRAPLDGSGPVLWRQNIEMLVPGPNDQWLAKREITGDEGSCQAFVVGADGSVKEVDLPLPKADYECPLGWFDSNPLIWRPTESYDIGDILLAGASPKKLLEDVPFLLVGNYSNFSILGQWIVYSSGGTASVNGAIPHAQDGIWVANLQTGDRWQVSRGDSLEPRTRVSIRSGLK